MIESDLIKLYFRNITQTYVQSIFIFNRDFYVRSFHEFVKIMKTLFDCILKMMKSLYEIFETDNHWFFIYHKHHIERFVMIESIYDSCLFYRIESFVVIDFRTDDILIFVNNDFAIKKNEVIKTVNIMFKQRECFIIINSIKFNGMKIELSENETISIKYALNVKNILLIKNYKSSIINFRNVVRKKLTSNDQYIAHRTRNAYVISICQSETSFDFSYAAQAIIITSNHITSLNKRLKWQIENKTQNFNYVKLDINSLRLMIFIDFFWSTIEIFRFKSIMWFV